MMLQFRLLRHLLEDTRPLALARRVVGDYSNDCDDENYVDDNDDDDDDDCDEWPS